METIRGRKSLELNIYAWKEQLATDYEQILLDLGTGDGRYARTLAQAHPDWFIVGIDSCRENLREHSLVKLPNLLFVIAGAQNLPQEMEGLFSRLTINFPWGSLLESLLAADPRLMGGLHSVTAAGATLSLRLNGGALAEAGKTLEAGTDRIYANLCAAGWRLEPPVWMDRDALRKFPSTWAKRLAFGRDPRAVTIRGQK
jgi:16S rRNA (adenine(1408)-N(1))-methyltransferase